MNVNKGTKEIYKSATPIILEAWNLLVKAKELAGDKDFYYMVLRLEKEINDSAYKLHPNPQIK